MASIASLTTSVSAILCYENTLIIADTAFFATICGLGVKFITTL